MAKYTIKKPVQIRRFGKYHICTNPKCPLGHTDKKDMVAMSWKKCRVCGHALQTYDG